MNNIRFNIGGVDYTWCGGMGCIISSRERGLKVGDCRVIADRLFYVYMVHPNSMFKCNVFWSMPNCSTENVRKFKRELFGYEENDI